MPETEIEPATLLAERLRAAVAALRAEDTVDTLLARADGALYASKHGGRNRVSVG